MNECLPKLQNDRSQGSDQQREMLQVDLDWRNGIASALTTDLRHLMNVQDFDGNLPRTTEVLFHVLSSSFEKGKQSVGHYRPESHLITFAKYGAAVGGGALLMWFKMRK